MLTIVRLAGTVTVSYGRADDLWRATALEFDVVGTGGSRDEAFNEMRELVNLYLRTYIESEGDVRFFNRSPESEHEGEESETYLVVVAVTSRDGGALPRQLDPADLHAYRNRISGTDLIQPPACPHLQSA